MRQARLARRADERDHLMLQILLLADKEVTAVLRMDHSEPDTSFVHHSFRKRNIFEPLQIAATETVESVESQCNRASGIGIAHHALPLFPKGGGSVTSGRQGFIKEFYAAAERCPTSHYCFGGCGAASGALLFLERA
jgi:hypothetical protein